jgi:hypothetical protein
MSDPLDKNQGDSICLANTTQTADFGAYINTCRKALDTSRVNNFFSKTSSEFKGLFQQLRAQYDNLIVMGDSQNSLASLSGNNQQGVSDQIKSLTKKKEELTYEVKKLQSQAQSSDKMFLDDIMHRQEKQEVFPSIQDFALGLFVFGWIMMSFVLIYVRGTSPGGGILPGFITFLLLLIVSMCLYGILSYVA